MIFEKGCSEQGTLSCSQNAHMKIVAIPENGCIVNGDLDFTAVRQISGGSVSECQPQCRYVLRRQGQKSRKARINHELQFHRRTIRKAKGYLQQSVQGNDIAG